MSIKIFFIILMLICCVFSSCSPNDNTDISYVADEISLLPATEDTEPVSAKIAYITIDDGPSRNNTPAILDILNESNVRATFFVLPHFGVDDIYRRIILEGHEIGNHSYSHEYKNLYGSLEFFREDVLKAQQFIEEKSGYMATTFRFPGGAMSLQQETLAPRAEILADLGYRYFDWNASTGDADGGEASKNPTALTNNIINNTRNRERLIILMHDTADKTATVEALPMIIMNLKEQGYVFDIMANY